jgi:hypothetical protein
VRPLQRFGSADAREPGEAPCVAAPPVHSARMA